MSFLDSLENNLKALESREEGGIASAKSRDHERSKAKAEAPWAERLRNDPWTHKLMQDVTRAGFQRRTKVNLLWMGNTLRMEARRLRLELRPETDGIVAVYLNGQEESQRERVDLKEDPGGLVARWMTSVDIQKKLDEEEAARTAAAFEDDGEEE
jgi:hypothetical protein